MVVFVRHLIPFFVGACLALLPLLLERSVQSFFFSLLYGDFLEVSSAVLEGSLRRVMTSFCSEEDS